MEVKQTTLGNNQQRKNVGIESSSLHFHGTEMQNWRLHSDIPEEDTH